MTVVIKASVEMLSSGPMEQCKQGALSVLLYAGDTLIIGASQNGVQELLNVIAEVGLRFGMELHWDKFQLLEVNAHYSIVTPTGESIQPSEVVTYLGANMYAGGAVGSEFNKKLGTAWAEFCKLHKLWNHSSLTMRRKVKFYLAVVVSRLLYGLSSVWLNVAESCRLNGFHARCLRKITGIKPSFVSRVSNAAVLQRGRASGV